MATKLVGMVVVCLALGCGGDDDGGDTAGEADGGQQQVDSGAAVCGGDELGSVSGTVAGEMVDPIAAAWSRPHPTFGYATLIVLDEDATASCGASGTGTGERLSLIFCDVPDVGEYEIVTPEAFPEDSCPGDSIASAIVEDEGGSDLDTAESGTVTIEATGACRSGTFSVTFATGTLSGDFAVPICD